MMKIKMFFLSLLSCITLMGCSNGDNSSKQSIENQSTESVSSIEQNHNVSRLKVIYFSCTNVTEKISIKISNYLNCNLEEILPLNPYTKEDLNYNNNSSRANQEQNDENARPEIANSININECNTIFIGYPIWWGRLPKIIYTFCDTYNLDNYTIIPFCTSGGSGISTSVTELKELEPNANILNGKRFNSSANDEEIKSFIDSLDLQKGEA